MVSRQNRTWRYQSLFSSFATCYTRCGFHSTRRPWNTLPVLYVWPLVITCLVPAQQVSTSAASTGPDGRTFTRLVVSPNYVFAALFEAHSISSGNGTATNDCGENGSAAAQFCAEHCYKEFIRNLGNDPHASGSSDLRKVLTETLKALDLAFLENADVQPQVGRHGWAAILVRLRLVPWHYFSIQLSPPYRLSLAILPGPPHLWLHCCTAAPGSRTGTGRHCRIRRTLCGNHRPAPWGPRERNQRASASGRWLGD